MNWGQNMNLSKGLRHVLPLMGGAGVFIGLAASPLAAQNPVAVPNKELAAAVKREMAKPFYVVEKRLGFTSLQAAIDAIGDGRGTIAIASGHYRQCAVQQAGEVALVAAEAGGAIFHTMLCEEKAGLVLRGQMTRLDGIIFENYRSPDGVIPASAIAMEGGALMIMNSLFRASDRALTTKDLPQASISIRQASFQNLGRCGGATRACGAAIHTGRLQKLRLIRNELSGANILTQAAEVDFEYNHFADGEAGPSASPMLDLASGAVGRIVGNHFMLRQNLDDRASDQQEADEQEADEQASENPATYVAPAKARPAPIIALASRDQQNPSRGLLIDENQLVSAGKSSADALFVANYSGENIAVGNNIYGAGVRAYDRPQRPAPKDSGD